jgi:hypothetical protein
MEIRKMAQVAMLTLKIDVSLSNSTQTICSTSVSVGSLQLFVAVLLW